RRAAMRADVSATTRRAGRLRPSWSRQSPEGRSPGAVAAAGRSTRKKSRTSRQSTIVSDRIARPTKSVWEPARIASRTIVRSPPSTVNELTIAATMNQPAAARAIPDRTTPSLRASALVQVVDHGARAVAGQDDHERLRLGRVLLDVDLTGRDVDEVA